MKLRPINKAIEDKTKELLSSYYSNDMISAEKKNYLTMHSKSVGPYLAVQGDDGQPSYLLDAASQIATLGLGFNPSVFMGAAQQLSSWVNRKDTDEYIQLRTSFNSFMKRKTGWKKTFTTICNSGAEANEIALGFCYKNRVNKEAKKVLAFEGSFHGRMLISLASTWNKSKREPFQFPGFDTVYNELAPLKGDVINQEYPNNWIKQWDNAVSKKFSPPADWSKNEQIQQETSALLNVRDKLLSNEIFAVIIEPMQCEGGDRYISNRFHSALIAMANSFDIPVIHDEVQTGFHLGREFFWHTDLNLVDDQDHALYPNYVVCAKKAQVGLVLSHQYEDFREEFHSASLLRGYLHAKALNQATPLIIALEENCRARLKKLVEKYQGDIESPRSRGLSFCFDLNDATKISEFIAMRFEHALLYYPAGSNTLRFRISTAFKEKDLNFLFEQLDNICDRIYNDAPAKIPTVIETDDRNLEDLYYWQNLLLQSKIDPELGPQKVVALMEGYFFDKHKLKMNIITGENFAQFKDQIITLQEKTYEPARQTSIEKFELTAKSEVSVCLGLTQGDKLAAIAFSSSLSDHYEERGVRRDSDFNNKTSIYMLDATVDSDFRSSGIGKKLKFALSVYAASIGVQSISGRNRDKLAAAMLNINLSIGALETEHITEDYPDTLEHRDVIYYKAPLKWSREHINLSSAIDSPLSFDELTPKFLQAELPTITNKVCLSNFVNTSFLDQVKVLFNKQPTQLQHGYTTSGQSECVDKIAKSIWYTGEKKAHEMLTFQGHYFGDGSFLSRSLSDNEDNFFPVTHLDNPHTIGEAESLKQLDKTMQNNSFLGLWIEPVEQRSFKILSVDFLKKVRVLCTKYNVPLIYNETASCTYRFDLNNFFCSNIDGIAPDASMTFLSGQIGIVNTIQKHFVSKPLMMISTWDGDEFSLNKFIFALKHIESDLAAYKNDIASFDKKLKEILSHYETADLVLSNGHGSFQGQIPANLAKYFTKDDGRYIICPSYSDLKSFISLGENI